MRLLQQVARAIWRETYRHDTLLEWHELTPNQMHHKRVMAAARAAMAAASGREDGEEWKDIPGFPRYEASTKGRIRRAELPDGTPIFHALKPYQDRKSGHLRVSVYRDKKQHRKGVHQLVALAFLGEPPAGKPLACHVDGDAGNCRPDNLYWGSHAENMRDMIKHAKQRSVEGTWRMTKVQERPQ